MKNTKLFRSEMELLARSPQWVHLYTENEAEEITSINLVGLLFKYHYDTVMMI